jgi:hypothetical protein
LGPLTPSLRKNCWNTKPIQAERSAEMRRSDSVATSWPRISIRPAVGRSSVPISCSSVDLPEPEGPTMPTISPSRMDSDTSRNACTPPG